MRTTLLVVALASCSGSSSTPSTSSSSSSPAVALPVVDDPAAVATKDPGMPMIVLVDDQRFRVAVGPSTWGELASTDLAAHAKVVDLSGLGQTSRLALELGARRAIDEVGDIGRLALEDNAVNPNPASQDDPPPPPEEDTPDDGTDGSGSASAPRTPGVVAHDVRATGWRKMPDTALPERAADIEGVVKDAAKLDPKQSTLVLAPPNVKAARVVAAIVATRGLIGVAHHGAVRALRLEFIARDQPPDAPRWLEVRLDTHGAVVEAVPDVPVSILDVSGRIDRVALATTFASELKRRGLDPGVPVDVLVSSDADAQRLVDALDALEGAGARSIGLGGSPKGDQIALRGHRIAVITTGRPMVTGDLDNAVIRRDFKAHLDAIHACYDTALATAPQLGGTMSTSFTITPSGKVLTAAADGVDPKLATCVREAIEKITFTKPTSGNVAVFYPITFELH